MRKAIHSINVPRPLATHLPIVIISIFLCLTVFLATNTFAVVQSGTCNQGKAFDKASVAQKAVGLQIPFIANEGQIDRRVRFYAQTFGGKFYLTERGELVYTFSVPDSREKGRKHQKTLRHMRVLTLREQLIGASQVSLQGVDRAPAKINYFTGKNRSNWKTNIHTYNTVSLGNVYEGIELSLKAYGDNVEKIFTVQPSADFSKIKLRIEGATDLKVNNQGELEIISSQGVIRFSEPRAYQEKDDQRKPVYVAYRLQGNTYGFNVAGHDPALPIIIDPCIVYSSYLGGSSDDMAYAVATGQGNSIYLTGSTYSSDFPVNNAQQDARAGAWEAFITKLIPNGDSYIIDFSTYLGGDLNDFGHGIAVDNSGNAYVAGETYSKNFPVINAFDSRRSGKSDAFVVKLNADGNALVYATYLGGYKHDKAYAIAIDTDGFAYVTGQTRSYNFPDTSGAFARHYKWWGDAFVTKINPSGNGLVYSTFLGGFGYDKGYGIALDDDLNAYVTGESSSRNFYYCDDDHYDDDDDDDDDDDKCFRTSIDAFVAKLNQTGSHLVYSKFLGGGAYDSGFDIAVDAAGYAHITGTTASYNFPTTDGAFDHIKNGSTDGFAVKLNISGSSLLYATFIGGGNDDAGYGIALDPAGNILITGETNSPDLPSIEESVHYGGYDAFVMKLVPDNGSYAVDFSTYFGGDNDDTGYGISIDADGNVCIAGATHGFSGDEMSDSDAFIAVIANTDTDEDGIADQCDNCPAIPNGPALGTCTNGDLAIFGDVCTSDDDCGSTNAFCSMDQEDFDSSEGGDACDDDDDNDALTDIWEIKYGDGGGWLNPQDPDTDGDGIADGDEDLDEGGLLNIGEQVYQTNPYLKDTDGDVWSDLMEVQAGTGPTDIASAPGADIFVAGIFVDKNDGDDLNLGTEAYPLKSIHAAFERLNMLEQGHYTIRFQATGTYRIGDPEPDTPMFTGQNVTIEGAGVIMDGTGASSWTQGFAFSPLSSNITINGLNIVNFNEALVFTTDGGCAFLNSVTISNCRTGLQLVEAYQLEVNLVNSEVSNCLTGVEYAGEGSDNSVNGVTISGNFQEAVKVSGGTGNQLINPSITGPGSYGLKIEMGVDSFNVNGGTIENTGVGISFATDAVSLTVTGATIQNCRAGVEFLENYMVHLDLGQSPENTLITGCEAGILFTAGSSDNTVLNGTVQGNDTGIRFERCADDPGNPEAPDSNQIVGTVISNSTDEGIAIVAGSANQLNNVTVSGSDTGVFMGSASSYNVLRGGSVSGNNENFNLDGSSNTIEGPMILQNFGQISGKGNELVDITLDGQSTEPYGLLLDQGSEEIILQNVTIQNYDIGIGFNMDAGCLSLAGVAIQYCRIGMAIHENYMLNIDLGDTVISRCETGIEIAAGSSDNILRNGIVELNSGDGILVDGRAEAPDDNQIIGTMVQNNGRNGIALLAGLGNEVIGCTVTGNNLSEMTGGYGGVVVMNGSGTVKTSRIYNNGCTGVYMDDSAVANIIGNLIYDSPEGIRVALASNVTLESNTITANYTAGIVVEDGALPLIKYNILYGNGTGAGASTDVSLEGDFNPVNLVENNIGNVNQIDLPPSNLSVDPQFCASDPSKCAGYSNFEEYMLQPTSFCIDGTTANEPGIDINGLSRPKGLAWDMGALETPTFRDVDDDGLPDPWEEEHFGLIDCETCGPGDDFDGDGVSNLQEYLEGSDPNNPVYVRITSPATSPFFTNDGSSTIGGISVNASSITVTNGSTTGAEAWSADVSLEPGGNVILVTATGTVDSTEYTATDTITVVKDSASPTVSIISPTTEGTYTTTLQSIILSGLANDDTEVASVSWAVVAGGPQNGPADGTASWSAGPILLPAVTADPVSITVRVTATDMYGNAGNEDIIITRVPGANNVDEDLSAQGSEPSADNPLDVDGDGYLNDDEIACGSDPLCASDPCESNLPATPSNYNNMNYPTGHGYEGYRWPDCLNPDIDGDGLPNWWEEEHFAGSPTGGVAENDDDSDGLTNLEEYQLGTNPTIAQTIAFMLEMANATYSQWLPEFENSVLIRATWVSPDPAPAQAVFSLRMTSNYPGRDENSPDPADMAGGGNYPSWYDYHGHDFGLSTVGSPDCNAVNCYSQGTAIVPDSGGGTYEIYLHSWDYGGRTKILVSDPDSGNNLGQLWVPAGSDKNGISSAWTTHGDLTGMDPNADTDAIEFGGLGYTAPLGDDFTHFEEYRGISYTPTVGAPVQHLRLNPFRKDLFVRGEGFSTPYNFEYGDAFANAGIDVHDTTGWGHDTTEDGSFFIYFGEGNITAITADTSGQFKEVAGSGTNWSTAWPRHEWEFELNGSGVWLPVGYWGDSGAELGLDFEYEEVAAGSYNYRIRKPLPHINVLIIRHDPTDLFGSPDGHIRFVSASPPSQQNPLGTRYWRWATKGYAWCQTTANQASMYGLAVSLQTPLDHYFNDRPYTDGTTWGNSWFSADGKLNPLSIVEDQTDQLDPIDGILGDGPDGNWDGDRRITTFDADLNPFDIDNNGLVELPLATDPDEIDPMFEYNLSDVFIHTITHEIAHALAGPSHTNDPNCLMYRYSLNWSRQDHLSDYYKSLLRIHNIVR